MKESTWFKDFNKNQNFATLAAFLLVLIMNLSTLFILVRVGEQIFPVLEWKLRYLVWCGFIGRSLFLPITW